VTDANAQQVNDIQNAMSQVWPTFLQYGDNVFSRIQAMTALRAILPGQMQLTGQSVGLAADGFSIYVRSDSGLPVVLVLDDLADMLPAATQPDARARLMASSAAGGAAVTAALAAARSTPAAPLPARTGRGFRGHGIVYEPGLSCGGYTRDIVANNKVMVWSPGDIFGFRDYRTMVTTLKNSVCPAFQVDALTSGDATIAALNQMPNYGTIIMSTHGAWDQAWIFALSGEPAARDVVQTANAVGIEGSACTPQGCFKTVYPNNPNIHALSNTIIYAGFCHSADYLVYQVGGFHTAMAPPGSQSTYFGYVGTTYTLEDTSIGQPLIDALVNQYQNTGTAYGNVRSSGTARGPQPRGRNHALSPKAIVIVPKHFQIWGDQNLAYVGNPSLMPHALNPPVAGARGFAASLDGTSSCGQDGGSYMSVAWSNPAQAGHLTWQTPLENGMQDSFVNYATQPPDSDTMTASSAMPGDLAIAKYMPSPDLPGLTDNLMAEFYPDPNNSPAAVGCLTVNDPAGLFVEDQLAAIWDAQQPSQIPGVTGFPVPPKISQTYSVPVSDPGGNAKQGAKATVTVSHNGPGQWTVTLNTAGANPNYPNNNPKPGSGPFMGRSVIKLGAINPGPPGRALVRITGSISNQPGCQTVTIPGPPPVVTHPCTSADGTIVVGDSLGKIVESGSLFLGDKNAVGSSVTVTADSSCSDQIQPTSQCPTPGPVGIAVSLTEAVVEAPAPVPFSVTLNIQFVNQ
jgi:hypothetical protein